MNAERILQVLIAPHTSEKSSVMADKFKQYTFKVLKNSNKAEIKKAVEDLFSVKVRSVATVSMKGKTKRFKQREGKRNDWKKAYVSLCEGHDISFAVKE